MSKKPKRHIVGKKKPKLDFDPGRILGNLRYDVDYTMHSGPPDGGCLCSDSDYCRCSIIHFLDVVSVDLPRICKNIMGDTTDEILQYCVDRLLRIHKIYSPDVWSWTACGGYYGEEVESIKLHSEVAHKLASALYDLKKLETDIEKVKYVLVQEYGYLLPKLESCQNARIISAPFNCIEFPNEAYAKKVEDVPNYQNHTGILGVVTMDTMRLIDGYHRYVALLQDGAKENTRLKVKVICIDRYKGE